MLGRFLFVLIFTLLGCSSLDYRLEQTNLLKDVSVENFDDAYKKVIDKEFLNENESILLRKLEQGAVAYYAKKYYIALKYFDDAHAISVDLYTKRLGNKISAIIDEASDIYYGLPYEIALIRFYQSLLHYKLHIAGEYESGEYLSSDGKIVKIEGRKLNNNEVRSHLFASRSVIIDWNNFNDTLKQDKNYIDSQTEIVLRIWGAFIHSQLGTRDDRRIAIDLLKNAKEILDTRGMLLSAFNYKNEELFNHIKKKRGTENIERFIKKTDLARNLENYLDSEISDLKRGKNKNFTMLMLKESVPKKEAKKTRYIDSIESVAMDIEYETLYIERKPSSHRYSVKIKDLKRKKIISEKPMTLMAPLGDIAFLSIQDQVRTVNLKAHARVAAKLATYYATEQSLKDQPLAVLAARIAMLNSINDQKVDLRQWVTLPLNIFIMNATLPVGNYIVEIYDKDKKAVYKNELEINGRQKFYENFDF